MVESTDRTEKEPVMDVLIRVIQLQEGFLNSISAELEKKGLPKLPKILILRGINQLEDPTSGHLMGLHYFGCNINYSLNSLENSGLILRVRKNSDRRSKKISLTKEGERVLKEGMEVVEMLRTRLSTMGPDRTELLSEAEETARALLSSMRDIAGI